jgi:GNAT superfamily N-acetyltransferase
MPTTVVIRPIEPSDSVEELTKLLHRAYAPLGELGLNYTAVDQTAATTAHRIAKGQCFVAVESSTLVGTIVVDPPLPKSPCEYFARPEVASAHQFAVAPEHQGRGLGVQLLQCAESWAKGHGYAEMAIDTAEPADHLISFYSHCGYRRVDWVQWEGKLYRSVVMSKDLHAV